MAKDPIWRATFATLAGTMDDQVERLLASEAVAVAVGLIHTVQRDITRRAEQASSRVWHALNLPTSGDVNRLFVQLGSVEREIRGLDKRIQDAADDFGQHGAGREVILGAKAHRPDRSPRPRPS